jgi:DegV family protein with EDD domain
MSKVAIVTDSGASLPPEISAGYPIFEVPFQLVWGSQVYLDGVDLQSAEFYTRLKTDKVFPTTSQPAPMAYFEVFKSLIDQGYQVLGIFTSSRLSGSFSSAVQACKMLPGALLHLVDSQSSAMEMGFHVLAAARAAVNNASLSECAHIAEQARLHTGVFFVLNTLDYLQRGGRIGGAAAFLGNVFNLKPILHVLNGRINAVGRVRTMHKALESLLEIVGDRIHHAPFGYNPIRLCALYANEPERAKLLLEIALQKFQSHSGLIKEAFCSKISPVIGVHTGPDGVGLAYMVGM